ncbi:MAG: PIN domain-containing protein [Candidatus Omnitrophica bacterium]|nr:PIN domain-containing protein [Candidatus Omnitrophota bacterium]
MTGRECFVDANIFIYAHDVDEKAKHTTAKDLVQTFWNDPPFPSISIQVLQECYFNLIKKKIRPRVAFDIVDAYLDWHVIINDKTLLSESMLLHQKLQLSFWDAMIIAAAKSARTKYLLSEDFSHGQIIEGVKIINPFRHS